MARKGTGRRRKEKNSGNHDVLGVVLFIVALFLFLCAAIPPFLSVFSQAIHAVLLGVFGILTYPMLLAALFWGVCLVMHRSPSLSVRKSVCIALLAVFVSIILQLATTHNYLNEKFTQYITDVYSAKFTMGGVVFGTIAFGLKSAITEIGCYVVFSLAVLVTVAVMIELVRRIREFRAKRANAPKKDEQKPAPCPSFQDAAEAQGIVASGNRGRLTLINLAPAITTDTGVSSSLPESSRRNVTDYGSEPVVDTDDDEELRERERNVHELYADVDTITKKETEEFKRRVEGPQKPEKPPAFEPQYGLPTDIPPYARVEHDATAAQNPPAPKRYDHDASDVTQLAFPVKKEIEFNRDGIETVESIGDYLRENSERRKRSDLDGRAQQSDPPRYGQAPGFSSHGYDRIKPPSDVFDTNREDIVQAAPDEDISALGSRASFVPPPPAPAPQDGRSSIFDVSPSSRDDALMASLGESNSSRSEIINIQQIQNDANSVQTPVEGEIIDASASVVQAPDSLDRTSTELRSPSQVESTKPSAPIIDANAPIRQSAPSVTPDSDNGIVNIDSGTVRPESTLVISSEPAVDLSERHDINGDLIDGTDLSGAYTQVEDEQPQKPSPQRKKIPPIKDQITMDNVIRESAENSVVMNEGHKRMKYGNYVPPPIDLLRINDKAEVPMESLKETAATLESVVSGFLKADVKVINIVPGPTVTRYEIELPSGVPVKQIEARSSDIEYELATISKIRIEAPIPGKRAVGIEVPNREKAIVGLRDIIESHEFAHTKSPMTISVGKDIAGAVVLCDLEKIPHLLIAGQTGSGKSACLNGLIISLLYKASPEDLRFILVDPKRVEFSKYRSMPHLLFDNIVYEPDDVLSSLKWAANEMERRYMLMSKYGCSQLSAYNALPDVVSGNFDKLPHIIVIIDELADIMQSPCKRDIEDKIKVIAAKARAAGIHLIVATQRPSADVITGTIKTNLTSRIAFKVSTQLDSRIIFDTQGAEALVGNGDMLFYPVTYSAPRRVQGSYITDEEVSSVITYIKENYPSDFDEEAAKAVFGGGDNGGGAGGGDGAEKEDVLTADVLSFVIRAGNASTSSIQRRFSIGYARAARIIDNMEAAGYIGKNTGSSKPRDVYITPEQYRELYNKDVEEN